MLGTCREEAVRAVLAAERIRKESLQYVSEI